MVGVGLRIEVVSSVSGKEEGPKSKLQTAKGTKATRLERRIDKTPGIHQLAAPFCSTPAALSGGAVCRSSPQSTKIPHVQRSLLNGRLLQTTALYGTHAPGASASAEPERLAPSTVSGRQRHGNQGVGNCVCFGI